MDVTPEALEALARAHADGDDLSFYSVLNQVLARVVRSGSYGEGGALARRVNALRIDAARQATRRLRREREAVRAEEVAGIESQVATVLGWGWHETGYACRGVGGHWRPHSPTSLHVSDVHVYVPNWPEP